MAEYNNINDILQQYTTKVVDARINEKVKVIDLGSIQSGLEFDIAAENVAAMFNEYPPVIRLQIANYKTDLVRHDISGNLVYYSSNMVFNDIDYFIRMVVDKDTNKGTVVSIEQSKVPKVSRDDNDKVLGVANGEYGLVGKWSDKQDKLVSGTNIKTINDQDILGSGNLNVACEDLTFSNTHKPNSVDLANINAGGKDWRIVTSAEVNSLSSGLSFSFHSIQLTNDMSYKVEHNGWLYLVIRGTNTSSAYINIINNHFAFPPYQAVGNIAKFFCPCVKGDTIYLKIPSTVEFVKGSIILSEEI